MTASALKLSTVINTEVAPSIFSSGPESLDIIKIKFSKTYWKKALVKDTVKNVLSYNTKNEINERCKGPAMHVPFLLQDSVDDNLVWKTDVNPEHPLYKVCQFVDKKIKFADKQNTFNLAEKFIELTRPPFGLYQSYAGMGMLAFAMRPYVNKIFDLNGKPREAQHLIEDVVEVFKAWEEGRQNPKVTFRFETPEEGKLCKAFIKTFNLTSYKGISEISSLKNARWVMTHSYVAEKKYPLWALKYVSDSVAAEDLKKLVENLNSICVEIGSNNPNLLSETLEGLKLYEFELKNLINDVKNFRIGFFNFLKRVETVGLEDSEFDDAVDYISKHLQSEVGIWNEEEVVSALKDWKLSRIPAQPTVTPVPSIIPAPPTPPVFDDEYAKRVNKATEKVEQMTEISQIKNILNKLISLGYDQILDAILND